MPINLLHFVRKWNASTLTERSAAKQHFLDLCEALNVPHPTEADEIGASYTQEKTRRQGRNRRAGLLRCLEVRLLRLGVQIRGRRSQKKPTSSLTNTTNR